MRSTAIFVSIALTALAVGLETPAAAQGFGLPPAEPATVVEAVNECAALQISDGASGAKWVKDGWDSGRVSDNGKLPAEPIGMFRKDNVITTVTVSKQGRPLCSIDAWLKSDQDFALVQQDLTAQFGAGVPDAQKTGTLFSGAGKIVRFSRASDNPQVAIVAVVSAEEVHQ